VSLSPPDKRKQSVYFSTEILQEIAEAANRLDRSMSWIVQKAWRLARAEIARFPAPQRLEPGPEAGRAAAALEEPK
jgi:uncharacterized small protein (TIGR04563 family)